MRLIGNPNSADRGNFVFTPLEIGLAIVVATMLLLAAFTASVVAARDSASFTIRTGDRETALDIYRQLDINCKSIVRSPAVNPANTVYEVSTC
jgi:hypothetical protein